MLVDSHAHLDDRRFAEDLPDVLARAREAGVRHILTVGTGPASSVAAVALAEQHRGFIFAAAGVHPHDGDGADEGVRAAIERLALGGAVVAVGEAGLDYHYNHSSHAGQQATFEWQIDLALRADLPLIVHCREAYADCLSILSRHRGRGLRGVAHCFSGDWEQATAFLDLGFHLSLAGPLTFPKAETLREVARRAPADRLLIETDCPYLAPQPRRGTRNEPSFLAHTASALDALRVVNGDKISECAAHNAIALFGLERHVE